MKLPKDKKVYVIGMSGLEEELREEGISFTGGTVRPAHTGGSDAFPVHDILPRIKRTTHLNHLLWPISHWTPTLPLCCAVSM